MPELEMEFMHILTVRIHKYQREILKRIAKKEKMTVSDVIRCMIDDLVK